MLYWQSQAATKESNVACICTLEVLIASTALLLIEALTVGCAGTVRKTALVSCPWVRQCAHDILIMLCLARERRLKLDSLSDMTDSAVWRAWWLKSLLRASLVGARGAILSRTTALAFALLGGSGHCRVASDLLARVDAVRNSLRLD